ncbi:hypothetical protein CEE44_03140 [Candidatus Woesearchaeota archaeon B3_Woes]|nr:MAG: hypothetical protein CEE44_03140 [Candidatus Woesearchaeota archaeon B3_Woes]
MCVVIKMIIFDIIGLVLLVVVPGYFLVSILFKKIDLLEKIALSVAFSLSINILIGLVLGFLKMFNKTNLWISSLVVTGLLFLVYYLKK